MQPDLLAQFGLHAELPQVYDNHFTGTFGECQRMAYYQNVLGRRVRGEQYALVWGAIFHRLAEIWGEAQDIDRVIEVIDQNIPEIVEDRYGRDRGKMQEMFLKWVKFRKSDPLEILRTEQPAVVACIGSEPCVYSETGCNLVYGGRIDQIVRWNALIGPLDIKTTTSRENDPAADYQLSHQMEGYVWLASHLLGKHCWGVIVERIIANKSEVTVDRFPVPYSRDRIWEWVENERRLHADIAAKPLDNELEWRQNYARCHAPARHCRFIDVCLSPRAGNFRLRWLRDNTEELRFNFQEAREERENATR